MESHFIHCYLIHYIREDASALFAGDLTCKLYEGKHSLRSQDSFIALIQLGILHVHIVESSNVSMCVCRSPDK